MTVTLQTVPVIAFRADASRQIGTGHVMRCLTLADTLSDQGVVCHFLCRPHDGHLIERIESHGHTVHQLPLDEALVQGKRFGTDGANVPAHACWLGVPWEVDAEQSSRVLACLRPDWLVVDHYALDARWEEIVAAPGCRVMVIDDLADRSHCAEMLLDQNLGRCAADYADLVQKSCHLQLGPTHALLRPEFSEWRNASLARRQNVRLQRLLITMGGVDTDNITSQVLYVLNRCRLPNDLEITVIMGSTAPWLDAVRYQAQKMRNPTKVVVDVDDMARRMTESDLAIGAAGSTSWERCCLGLPTVMLVLADNQTAIAQHLHAAQAAINIGSIESSNWENQLERVVAEVSANPLQLRVMTERAASLTEGQGVWSIVNYLLSGG
ncbi:UDP-2,4-diacetamido-2,4,6-trideoxy-beta-L-altropyranose hydrolase [Halomonas sp. YLB-10]|uniref:UDP-2,4-diacetamido-2,4, 6-trideoxy-beta-L-altropyranose hydrolase n=1 Tax=Halomonas sp. YLB-10 TaxID=2483111 RepID=UPI000F5F7BCF|nr:UDP-2,4-diacetamido-2,4,6-trideoxy-beta-L-altropyranose hydrolase [Halomonas sp. YLB-10]RQW70845.1 UDP-2,4-diacetamido-2,4,6-trideoxy-beta-L-altropyranose hydrolase [Halomonas sp. YLB-10]